jgi:YHS domain-containing protein
MAAVWGIGFLVLRASEPPPASHDRTRHGHQAQHGGQVQSVGANHVELVLADTGQIRAFVLGKDEQEIISLPISEIAAEVQLQNVATYKPLTLRAEPQPGDAPGMASRFVGYVPPDMAEQPLQVTLTIPQEGKQYRVRFAPAAHAETAGHPSPEMPASQVREGSEKERKLYLTPDGLYTQADIEANGNTVASAKFRNFQPKHNMFPQKGERICPITNTAAHPACAWIVGGKTYRFCCPPCVEEFVRMAKEQPAKIRAPEEYVKK